MRVVRHRGAGGIPHMAMHGDKGGDDNEDTPFMNESINFFDLDWVLE